MPMPLKRATVHCIDCGHESIKTPCQISQWKGRCKVCSVKELLGRPGRQNHYTDYVTTHGMHNSRLYKIWENMKTRTGNPNSTNYKNYGGRGITVTPAWSTFESFHSWAISRNYTDTVSLDRVDNNGPYGPDNCRWATRAEQTQNRRTTKMTPETVLALRTDYSNKIKQKDLALKYNLDATQVSRICSRACWKNI